MADPIYITLQDLYSIVKSSADVYIMYRPIPGAGDAVCIMPGATGMRKRLGSKAIIVMYGLEYANTVFEHNDVIDFIVPCTAEQVKQGIDLQNIKQLETMNCTVYRLEHPCPCGFHEENTEPYLRRSRVEIFSEACGVEFNINNYNFVLHEEDLAAKERLNLPDRYIVVGVQTSTFWKNYIYIGWLIKKLVKLGKQFGFQVVTMDEHIQFDIKDVISLVQQKLTDLYGVIAQSLMTVSMDSAYAHIAGALEVPIFGIYGPTPPEKFLRYKKTSWLSSFIRCNRQYCWYQPCKLRPCLAVHPNKIVREIKIGMEGFALI